MSRIFRESEVMIDGTRSRNVWQNKLSARKRSGCVDAVPAIIADNIANADVPHFKKSEITYEAQLRRALEQEQAVAMILLHSLPRTPYHFIATDFRSIQLRKILDYQSRMRNDGNNVDPEVEVTNALKNQRRYQALMSSLNDQFKTMNLVIRTTA